MILLFCCLSSEKCAEDEIRNAKRGKKKMT